MRRLDRRAAADVEYLCKINGCPPITAETITALEAFNKFYNEQTSTPGPSQPAPGMTSMLCACARMHVPRVTG